ncbi:hypothetical protein CYY_004442 [Polysphondylium violaceum]|uniref:W2 domain-containing protein n=1 Tax=Polysphondylium violaceum TaxID=133409 RepID=A0A8J4PTD2_9MYCE|nr:hypothetical protein CYY_004442 [Polysphondylium violaceum]
MEVLQAKVEGKGNGIKTVIVNLQQIAKDLDRPPEYITKYFEIELNTKSNFESDRYSVNGQHSQERLSQILDGFIGKFVLCSFCKNPETKSLIKNSKIDLKCAACGRRSPLDMKAKLSSYILKNPPKESSSKSTHDEAPQAPSMKEASSASSSSSSKRSKKKKGEDDDEEEVVWLTDTSEKAAEERKRKAIGDSTSAVLSMVDIGDKDPVSYLYEFISKGPTDDAFMEELNKIQEEFGLRSYATARSAIEALGNKTTENTVKMVKNKNSLLQKIAKRRDGKLGICLGLEELCAKDETLLKSIQGILKNLYDADILTEEIIIKWHTSKAKSEAVIKATAKFVEWLQTAEEEEDEDDEENEEDEE